MEGRCYLMQISENDVLASNYKSRPKYVKCNEESREVRRAIALTMGKKLNQPNVSFNPALLDLPYAFLLSHLPASSIPRAIIPMKLPQAAMQSININLRTVTCTSYYLLYYTYLTHPWPPLPDNKKNPSFGLRSQRACWRWCYLRNFTHCRFGGRIVNACVRLFFSHACARRSHFIPGWKDS